MRTVAAALLAWGAASATAQPTVSTTVSGEVEIEGVGSGANPVQFFHRDEQPSVPVDIEFEKKLRVSEDLGHLATQVYAEVQLSTGVSDEGDATWTNMTLEMGTFVDPIFSDAIAASVGRMTKQVVLDRDYRYAITWEHQLVLVAGEGQTLDLSRLEGPRGTTVGADLAAQGLTGLRESDIAPAGAAFNINLWIELYGDAYPPFRRVFNDKLVLRLLLPDEGATQETAVQPEVVTPGSWWQFLNFPTGLWFDPPGSDEMRFQMISEGTLFDRVLDFPTGLNAPVTVIAEGQDLGQYGPDQTLDFVAALGHGVAAFTVLGIDPAAATGDMPGFALQLDFNTETADFEIIAVSGDFDRDADVDSADLDQFTGCLSGPAIPYSAGCENADLDDDGDVDQADFGDFQVNYTGAENG